MSALSIDRATAARINPLLGVKPADTLSNVCDVLCLLACVVSWSDTAEVAPDVAGTVALLSVVRAAVEFEAAI